MAWIKTDVHIGVRLKCFELPFCEIAENYPAVTKEWNATVFSIVFERLQVLGKVPVTATLVRVDMPMYKMAIVFTAQDSSFVPINGLQEIPTKIIDMGA